MASPADPATPGSPHRLAPDPWDWTVDDVVAALCDPSGILQPIRPEPVSFAKSLRENDVHGAILLTRVDDAVLRNEMGIGSFGQRGTVEHAILELRILSPKWRGYKEKEAVSSVFSGHGLPSNQAPASAYGAPYQTPAYQYANPMMPALNRYLSEPFNSPGRIQRSIQGYHVIENPINHLQHQTLNGHIGHVLNTPDSAQPDPGSQQGRSPLPGLVQSNNHEALFQQEEGYHSSGLAHSENRENDATSLYGRKAQDQMEIETSLRPGETFVVDDSGRKRRRLQLGASTLRRALSSSPIDVSFVATTDKLNNADDQQASNIEKALLIEEMPDASLNSKGINAIEDPAIETREHQAELAVKAVPEPGQLVINSEGRKRMRPVLVSHDDDSKQVLESLSKVLDLADLETPPTSPAAGLSKSKGDLRVFSRQSKDLRKADQVYLGLNPSPVDEVFYGMTPIGHEVRDVSRYETISSSILPGHPEEFVFQSGGFYSAGQQIYVKNRIQHFLLAREVKALRRKEEKLTGILPYPSRIAKRHQLLSFTLLRKSDSGMIAERANRSQWFRSRGTEDHATDRCVQDANSQTQYFDVDGDGDDSLLRYLGENEITDWDYLEKWRFQQTPTDVLPLYGDSGSENEFDLDTWREIEEETGELDRPMARTKCQKLGPEEVLKTIEEATAAMIEDWRAKRLPQLDYEAWSIWTKSRRDKNRRDQIKQLSYAIDCLNTRLDKIRKELLDELWSSTEQLSKQCKCMQESIFDREGRKWRIQILEMRSPPKKPQLSEKKTKKILLRSMPESLEEGEEDLGTGDSAPGSSEDDDLEDFVVDDDLDDISATEHMDVELADDGFEEFTVGNNIDTESTPKAIDINIANAVDEVEMQFGSPEGFTPSIEEKSDQDDQHGKAAAITIQEDSDDEIVTPSKRHGRRRRISIVSEVSLSLSPVKNMDSAIEDIISSPDMILDQLGAAEQQSEPELPLLPRVTVQPPSRWEIIDLTQQSDPEQPELSSLEVEQYKIRTPPILRDDEDPFFRDRKIKAEFIPPSTVSTIVELEDGYGSMEDDNLPPTPKPLPDLLEVDKIALLDPKYLQERQDRKRLLIWIIKRAPSKDRKLAIKQTTGITSAENQLYIWECLRSIEADEHIPRNYKLQGFNDEEKQALMRMATWYISWSQCVAFSEKVGIPLMHLDSALKDIDGFEPFYDFLLECLRYYKNHPTLKQSFFGKKGGIAPVQKRQKIQDSSDDAFDRLRSTPHKKRKYIVSESQGGRALRESAFERVQQRDARQKQMKSQLRNMGVNPEDLSKMAINMGVSATQELILLNPTIGSRIQPHQVEGVQFMWGELTTESQGCLLAHTMGLGKTMQVITLLVTIAEASKSPNEKTRNQIPLSLRQSRTLVLCPASLVDNWFDEFLMWTPQPSSENVGDIRKLTSSLKLPERLYEIQEWTEKGGILILAYTLFSQLIINKVSGKEKKPTLTDEQHTRVLHSLLKHPNIVVADEAHAMKSPKSETHRTTKRFRTQSRIALTGSPLANNLDEYFSIIDWIAPGYLGARDEFSYKYKEPIEAGLYQDSSANERRKGLKMLQVLKIELEPKVNRADISALKGRLPGKTEFVIRVPLTDLQKQAYSLYVKSMLAASKATEPGAATFWAWLAILRLLCNHPMCFRDKLVNKKNGPKSGLKREVEREGLAKKERPKIKDMDRQVDQTEVAASPRTELVEIETQADSLMEATVTELGLSEKMYEEQMTLFSGFTEPLDSINLAHKMRVLTQILNFSVEAKDKVLVFSHSLSTLDFVESFLMKSKCRFMRLDGHTKMQSRNQMTKDFNDGSAMICLISTKAGGQGINLYGANRVVLIDDHFNPMNEEQAIGRAYRFGQRKHVYVYRLTVGGTFEEALQNQTLFKLQLATRVVDKKNPIRHAIKGFGQYLFMPKTVEQKEIMQYSEKDELVLARILDSQKELSNIRSIDLSETFLQEDFEELTPEEKQEAQEMVEDANLRRTDPKAYEARQTQREQEERKKRLKFLDPLTTEAAKAPGVMAPTIGMDLVGAYGNNLGGLMPVYAGGGYFSPPYHNESAPPAMTTEVLSGRPSHGLPSHDSIFPRDSNAETANLMSPQMLSPGLSSFLPQTGYEKTHRTDVDKPGHDGHDQRTFPGGIQQTTMPSMPPKKSGTSTPSIASSGQIHEGNLPLHQDLKKEAREQIRSAILSQLPLLGKQNLFSSPLSEEAARTTSTKLERNASNHAKDVEDYKHRIESHIVTINTDVKHLAKVLKVMEEKLLTGKTTSI